MYLRSLAIEPPGFPRLDQASNPQVDWPVGTVPYLVGGRFMEFLQERSGDDAIAGYLARQGAQLWPYAPSWVGAAGFGAGFPGALGRVRRPRGGAGPRRAGAGARSGR